MLFSNTIVGLAAVAVAVVEAAAPPAVTATSSPFKVLVGKDGLTYTPSNIIAEIGTEIEFEFFPKNHTVTQSNFKDPCQPLKSGDAFTGFFSGFIPTQAPGPNPSTFTITVKDKKPIWFYCSQTTGMHCQKGMVGAINAPATGNTLDAFILLAANASESTVPPTISNGDDSGSASGGYSSSSSSSTAYYTSSAETTTAIVSTYTTESSTSISIISSSTILATGSSFAPAPTTSFVPVSGASGRSASLFGVAAILLGALKIM